MLPRTQRPHSYSDQTRRVRKSSGSLFDLGHVVNVPVKEVSHRVPDGCVFEAGSSAKHRDVGYGGAQLGHGLTLKEIRRK